MKWALLALACVSLFVCWEIGHLAMPVEVKAVIGTAPSAAADIATGYTGGTVGAGLIGTATALGVALIQISENKKKD